MLISGWGQNTKNDCNFNCPRNICELKNELKNKPLIARGNGRSYGDSSLNKNNTISMLNFNHFINFNPDNGLLVLESGVLLKDIIETFLQRLVSVGFTGDKICYSWWNVSSGCSWKKSS